MAFHHRRHLGHRTGQPSLPVVVAASTNRWSSRRATISAAAGSIGTLPSQTLGGFTYGRIDLELVAEASNGREALDAIVAANTRPAAVTTAPEPAIARMMPVLRPAWISSLNRETNSRL